MLGLKQNLVERLYLMKADFKVVIFLKVTKIILYLIGRRGA